MLQLSKLVIRRLMRPQSCLLANIKAERYSPIYSIRLKLPRLGSYYSSSQKFCQDISRQSRDVKLTEKDKIITIPNLLCVSRIALAPYIAHLVINGQNEMALGLFTYAAITDLLDGFIARNFKGQSSKLGSFLDPLADKILVISTYLSLTYAGIIPAALTSLVVSRDVLLVYAGCYIRYMGVEPPFTFKKYFDMTQPVAEIKPTLVSKVNTVVQLILIGSALTVSSLNMTNHIGFQGLCITTACTTFASAVSYAFMRDTYKFKHRSYDHQQGKKLSAFAIFILFNLGFVYVMPVKDKPANNSDNQS